MKRYKFTVEIVGEGETEEEAWYDAVEGLSYEPGNPATSEEIEIEEE